ncbi:MAG: galactose ABC transporter substrate-binding protein [Tissierellia bacterium]|nr:galactose ABC transporter substrate-binding protein [Tissierellia bacterium]
MFNKKTLSLLLALIMLLIPMAGCSSKDEPKDEGTKTEEQAEDKKEEAGEKEESETATSGERKNVAVFYYNYSDAYISTVRNSLNELMASDGNIEASEFDGQNDQAKQNDQIDASIEKGADILLVNIVDMGAAGTVIEKAKAADIPVIFFNREPTDGNVYATYDKARFVGTKIEEAGILQGELIKAYWEEGEHDRNGNGKLDYVLLSGGADNAEAAARSKYSVETLEEAGIEVNKIADQIANWDNAQAMTAMEAWLAKDAENIDVVIANNDSMAVGALNALQAAGLNKVEDGKIDPANFVGVFGVDATEEAQEVINQKAMSGTVKQDNEAMAKAIFTLMVNGVQGKEFVEGTEYEYDESGIAVRVPYVPYEAE